MANATDLYSAVFERGSAVFLARVVDAGGMPIAPADALSAAYTVSELSSQHPQQATPVAGHENVPMDRDVVLFSTLQTTPVWTFDSVGYNFRHEIDVSENEAFPNAGSSYQVRYEIQPQNGQRIVFRFLLRAI